MDRNEYLALLRKRIPPLDDTNRINNDFQVSLDEIARFANGMMKNKLSVPVIAVAGTNGKGSCATLIAQIYQNEGYRVGLFTSPHFCRINERIMINNVAISDDDLGRLVTGLLESPRNQKCSCFTILTMLAWQYFLEQSVQVMIFEVGLGGRLDSVNGLPLTAGVITNIGWDHMTILGNSLEKIAVEKSAIVRPNCPMIIAEPNFPQVAKQQIQAQTRAAYHISVDFSIRELSQGFEYHDHAGMIQLPQSTIHPHTLAGAVKLTQALRKKLPLTDGIYQQVIAGCQIPGRMECIDKERQIWVDVAHNLPAVVHLLQSWHQPWAKTFIVLQLRRNKDWHGIIKACQSVATRIYLLEYMDCQIDWHDAATARESFVPLEHIRKQFPHSQIETISLQDQPMLPLSAAVINRGGFSKLFFGCFHAVATAKKMLGSN